MKPKDWTSLAGGGTTDDERLTRVCECEACQRDGQHEPMCQVHDEDVPAAERRCDCGRASPPTVLS